MKMWRGAALGRLVGSAILVAACVIATAVLSGCGEDGTAYPGMLIVNGSGGYPGGTGYPNNGYPNNGYPNGSPSNGGYGAGQYTFYLENGQNQAYQLTLLGSAATDILQFPAGQHRVTVYVQDGYVPTAPTGGYGYGTGYGYGSTTLPVVGITPR